MIELWQLGTLDIAPIDPVPATMWKGLTRAE